MAETRADGIGAIERGIAANRPPAELLAELDALEPAKTESEAVVARFLLARGILENRAGIYRTALTTLYVAQKHATAAGDLRLRAAIARALAVVHDWRGDVKSAALELLKALALARLAGDAVEMTKAVAESARVNMEVGRFDAALEMLTLADSLGGLDPVEAGRVAINRCQALNAIGDFAGCRAEAERILPLLPKDARRLHFLVGLEKARALEGLGQSAEALSAADQAAAGLDPVKDAYEKAEHALLAGRLRVPRDPEAALGALQSAVERFSADVLPRHEIEARMLIAEALLGCKRETEASESVALALRRARDHEAPSLASFITSRVTELWPKESLIQFADRLGTESTGASTIRFLKIRKLGAGGSAVVYHAVDLETGSEVAIKQVRLDRAAGVDQLARIVEQIQRETKTSSKLRLRGVARVRYVDVGGDGTFTIVQDVVLGPTMRDMLLSHAEAWTLLSHLAKVSETVASLHRQGLVHRDLKPENVLVRDGTEPVIVDFGIAHIRGLSDTLRMGTPPYAAPEMSRPPPAEDVPWFGAEDVYALGAMAQEIWSEASAPAAEERSIRGWFRKAEAGMPRDLAATVEEMLVADPEKRARDLARSAMVFRQASERLENQAGQG